MPTATKVTKDIIEMKPMIVGQETTVTLVLTDFEAQILREAVGSVLGGGKIRQITDKIYEVLRDAGVTNTSTQKYFQRWRNLEVNELHPEN